MKSPPFTYLLHAYVGAVEAVADEVPPAIGARAEEAVDRRAISYPQVVHAARRYGHRVVRSGRLRRLVLLIIDRKTESLFISLMNAQLITRKAN